MVSEWREYLLGDVTDWKSGGTPSKTNSEFWGGDIPWISASSMDGHRYSDSKLKVTKLGLNAGTRIAKKNSILLLVRGSILHQKIQVGIAEKDISFNQDVKALVANEDILEPWYLLLWFISKEEKLLGLVENTGIGAGKLDTKILQNLPIKIPPKPERLRILRFAKSIEDKIEINRQLNQTLEQMAQALFKSWFVDFDPVIDNALAAGNPIPDDLQDRAERRQLQLAKADHQPLPENIRKLFPSEFELTESLGWVPKGWEASPINSFCEKIQNGGTPNRSTPEYWDNGTIPWLTSGEVRQKVVTKTENFITELGLKGSSAKPVAAGSTLIAMYGATAGQVAFSSVEVTTNQAVCALIPKKNCKYFVYLAMERCVASLENQARGSAQQNISKGIIEETLSVKSSIELLTQFEQVCASFFSSWICNLNMNEELAKLSDTLLPKLISGELRIPETL